MKKLVLCWPALAAAAALTSPAIATDLTHRWSFTIGPNQLNDSVGSANVSLFNTATITNNQLDLTANTGVSVPNQLATRGWAEIPAGGTIDGLTSATIEGWLTWGGPDTSDFQTPFSFGTKPTNAANAQQHIALLTSEPIDESATIDTGTLASDYGPLLGAPFPIGQEVHFAVVYDETAAKPLQLFTTISGHTFVSTLPTNGFTLAGIGSTAVNYLGQDFFVQQYNDPLWKGSINEMRIWNGAFDQAAFDADTALGPDALPPPPIVQWAVDGSGTWGDGDNWSTHAMPGADRIANFLGGLVTQDGVVTLDGDRTVAGLVFDNAAHGYTIAQGTGGVLALTNGAAAATIDVNSGTHLISAPVNLNSDTTITVAASSALNLTGAVVVAGGKNITKAGPGTVTVSGFEGTAGVVAQTGGSLNFTVDADKSFSAKQVVAHNVTLGENAVLTLSAGATGSKVETLSMNSTATLNVKDNSMVIESGVLSTVRSLVSGGRIMTDAVPPVGKTTAVGYAAGDDPAISGLDGVLKGQSFSAGSVILKYTYVGDANLDGSVDGSDVALWAQNFSGALGLNPPNPRTWTQGDWNNDGSVDGSDVALWAQNFTGALGGGGLGDAMAAAGPAISVEVPEPASLALLGIGALGLLARRRRMA